MAKDKFYEKHRDLIVDTAMKLSTNLMVKNSMGPFCKILPNELHDMVASSLQLAEDIIRETLEIEASKK